MSYAALARKSETASGATAKTSSQAAPAVLRIGEPDDAFEREADRVADKVMAGNGSKHGWSISRMGIETPIQRKCACGSTGSTDTECEECRGESQALRRRALGTVKPAQAPRIVNDVLRSPGQPLDAGTRRSMEWDLGHDLSRVRIHRGEREGQSARAVNALAYTVGQDIVFGPGAWAPGTMEGRRLLAHELAHTLQQSPRNPGLPSGSRCETNNPGEALEREAEGAASRIGQVSRQNAGKRNFGNCGLRLQRVSADPAAIPPGMSCVTDPSPSSGAESSLTGVKLQALTAQQKKQIAEFHKKWTANGATDFIAVVGYASPDSANDSASQQKANWRYSCHRAEMVQAEFVKLGVPRSRLITFAHGETDQFSTQDPMQNRRVDLSTVKVAGPTPKDAAPTTQAPGGFQVTGKNDGPQPQVDIKAGGPKLLPVNPSSTQAPPANAEAPDSPGRVLSITLEFDLKNDWKTPTPPPPAGSSSPFLCNHGVLQIGGKWNNGIKIFKDRLELLNEPELDVNIAPAYCGDNVGVTAQVNLIKFTILKKIIEADLVPIIGLPDGWASGLPRFPFTGGGQVKLQFTPFARLSSDFEGLKIGLFGGVNFEQGVASDAPGQGTTVKTLGGFIGLDYDVGPVKKQENK